MTSRDRVAEAAGKAGVAIRIEEMPASTRTAEEAAAACGCTVAQIVKSLVFEGRETGGLKLLLVSGCHQVDLDRVALTVGEGLKRAEIERVRRDTGFAIGGVAPFGHLTQLPVYMDETLLDFETVWAAAGTPNAVFSINPQALLRATGAQRIAMR